MNKIKTMIELLSYKQTLNKELTELQSKLKPIQENINSLYIPTFPLYLSDN